MSSRPNALKIFRQNSALASTAKSGLHEVGVKPPRIKIIRSYSSAFAYDVEVTRRSQHSFDVDLQGKNHKHAFQYIRANLTTILYQFIHCDEAIERATFNLSDGNAHSKSPFAFSTNRPDVHLLPDPYQFRYDGFRQFRELAARTQRPWKDRSSTLRWRGGDNGDGTRFCYPDLVFDDSVMQRIRLCLIAKDIEGVDCKLVPEPTSRHLHEYAHFGLLGEKIAETDWINDRYALDVDGYTNTWSNFVARMHLGCCVLKIDSQFGYRQWYYDRIEPWVHYVPVKADMSDLAEKLAWVRNNDKEAEEIARNGQAFARTLTMQSNTRDAVKIIEAHYAA